MNITFYINSEPKNKINKTPTVTDSFSGYLRDTCSIIEPVVMIETDSMPQGNYIYIDDFSRYYFIENITSIRTGLWEIKAFIDPLKSFAASILTQTVILQDTGAAGVNKYVNNDTYVSSVKQKTDIINFPSGLNDSGEFILITAGGAPTL